MLQIKNLSRPGLSVAEINLADGECVAITGPSGAGKTLLLRAIADLDPNQGEVAAAGIERDKVPAPQWRSRVIYLAAESGWWADQVASHFASPARAAELLPLLGLASDAMDWPVSRLSTGEKQRLALIRALDLEPAVLLLDEPTSALDEDNKQLVERILMEKMQNGLSILLVTHDAAQATRLAGRVLRLEKGRLAGAVTEFVQ